MISWKFIGLDPINYNKQDFLSKPTKLVLLRDKEPQKVALQRTTLVFVSSFNHREIRLWWPKIKLLDNFLWEIRGVTVMKKILNVWINRTRLLQDSVCSNCLLRVGTLEDSRTGLRKGLLITAIKNPSSIREYQYPI